MNKQSNKRRTARKTCLVPVDAKRGGVFDKTQTVDISRGGVGFVSRASVPVAEEIAVEIELSHLEAPVLVMGQVKWIQADRENDMYRFGIEFGKVLSGARPKLRKLVVA